MILLWMSLARASCTVLLGGTMIAPSGPLPAHSVMVLDGDRIAAVGPIPPQLVMIAGETRWQGAACSLIQVGEDEIVSAGLIEVNTQLGLVEVGAEPSSRSDSGGAGAVHAALSVALAYDPLSTLIPIARQGGITSAMIHPTGGMIAGQAAWVQLAGARRSQVVVEPSVAMMAALPGSSGASALEQLDVLLSDAADYGQNRVAYDRNQRREYLASARDLAALQPVLDGTLPLVVEVQRAPEIEGLIVLADRHGVRLVLRGGAEAWRLSDLLVSHNVAVIVDPLQSGATSFDTRGARADNAALLAEAGVDVILSSFSSHNARTLRVVAGNAVRAGMAPVAALNAITETPARVFGQFDRGRLVPGARADVVVWSGDPFELDSRALRVFIAGQAQPLRTRQGALLDRYRVLPTNSKARALVPNRLQR